MQDSVLFDLFHLDVIYVFSTIIVIENNIFDKELRLFKEFKTVVATN